MTIKEQAAYLQGMISGMELDETKNETKILKGVVNAIQSLSASFTDLDNDVEGILEQLQIVDEDLAAVEGKVFKDCCECDCDCDENCDCGCDCNGGCYEVVCTNCGEKICLSEDMLLKEKMNCPSCGELLEFDLDCCDCGCEECGDDCGCDEGSCDCECVSGKDKK